METKEYETEDRIIRYYLGGSTCSDETLFFLNGLYVGNKSWIKQQRYGYFRDNYKMIFMDYPGMGSSIEKKDQEYTFENIAKSIRNILKIEGCRSCTLIGYSIGGMIALWFISRFPEFVERLILLNTGADIDNNIKDRIEGMILELNQDEGLEKFFKEVYPWNHSEIYLEKIADIEASVIADYTRYNKNAETLLKFFNAILKCPNLEITLRKINIPTLIVGSDEDRIFSNRFQLILFNAIKDSKYYQIKQCGHSSCIEKYKEVNKIMEQFLKNFK